MKLRSIITLILCCIIAFLLFFSLGQHRKEKLLKQRCKTKEIELLMLNIERHKIKNNLYKTFMLSGVSLGNLTIYDKHLVPQNIIDVLKNKPKLILFFSEYNCEKCYEFELKNLSEEKELKKEDILVIAEFQNKRTYLAHLEQFKDFSLPIFTIENGNKALDPLLKMDAPVYFVYDQSLMANCVFFPDRDLHIFTMIYFDVVIKRYFILRDTSIINFNYNLFSLQLT